MVARRLGRQLAQRRQRYGTDLQAPEPEDRRYTVLPGGGAETAAAWACGRTRWMGQTVSGAPDAPTLQAKTLSDYEIELTWNEPKDNGEAITGYQIDWSADGSSDWQRLAALGADAKSYTDSTLPANTKRYYRVRAVNSVGAGAWSRTVSAITQLTPPDAPNIHQRRSRRPQCYRGHLGGAILSRRPENHPVPGAVRKEPARRDMARSADAVRLRALLASYRAETGRDMVLPGSRQQRRRTLERLVVHQLGNDGF